MATRTLQVALLALLLVTAGCLSAPSVAQTSGIDGAKASGDVRTIDVSAQGSVTAAPDLAVVRVAVEARADTAEAARQQVATDAERMREAIRALGIPDDAVETTSYFVGPEYDYRESGRELVGYRAYHAYAIESDVDRVGDVIDTAVGNGASQVQGVQFTLTDETRRELRAEALAAAMDSARADADTIASAAGVTLGPLHSASTADVSYPRPYAVTAEAGAADGARTVLEPGPVEVTASVSVSYAIR